MNILYRCFLTTVTLLFIVTTEYGQQAFTPIRVGPAAGSVTSLAIDSAGTLYCAGGAIYRSTPNGTNWERISPDLRAWSVAVRRPGEIFAGTMNSTVVHSLDSGQTWSDPAGVFGSTVVSVYFDTGHVVFAGSTESLFRSTNDGTSFRLDELLPGNTVYALLKDSDTAWYAATNSGIFRSRNHGLTWTYTENGFHNAYGLVKTYTGKFIAVTGSGIYRSTDKGVVWTKCAELLSGQCITALGISLFCGTLNGVYRSTDEGTTWTPVNTGLTSPWIRAIIADNTGGIIAGTMTGIFRSTDAGEHWTEHNSGLGDADIGDFVKDKNGNLLVLTGEGITRSTDDGATWELANSGLGSYMPSHLKAGGDGALYASGQALHRSTDHGGSWVKLTDQINGFPVSNADVLPDGTLFAGTDTGVQRSADGGTSWTNVYPTTSGNTWKFSVIKDSSDAIYIHMGSEFLRSTDNGNSFVSLYNGFTRNQGIAVNGAGMLFMVDEHTIDRSLNCGYTFEAVGVDVVGDFPQHLAVNSNGHLFVDNAYGVLFRSADNGNQWSIVDSTRMQDIRQLVIDENDYLYLATAGHGLLKSTQPTATKPAPNMYIEPRLDAGRIRRVHERRWISLTIYNSGMDTARIVSFISSDTLVKPGLARLDVPPHARRVDSLQVQLTQLGPFSTPVIIVHDGAAEPETVRVTAYGYGMPFITGLPDTIDFGTVDVSESRDTVIYGSNTGDDTLTMSAIYTIGPFSSRYAPLSPIPPGGTFVDTINFRPRSAGQARRYIACGGVWEGHGQSVLQGVGHPIPILALSPSVLPFWTAVGQRSNAQLMVYNIGTDTLRAWLRLEPGTPFTISMDSVIVMPGEGGAVMASYLPLKEGRDTAFMIVQNNTKHAVTTVLLSGYATSPAGVTNDAVVTEYALEQNYPNPFNPVTTIHYALPVESRVLLTVYSVLGERVAVLADEVEQTGYHTRHWDATQMPSGLYFNSLQASAVSDPKRSFNEVSKMVLLK